MTPTIPFDDVLESADKLSPDDQEALIAILHRRLAEAGRLRVAADVQEARQEFAAGQCAPTTTDALMREILG